MNNSEKQTGGSEGKVGSPISNQAYNVITALQAKLEGLEAYRKYSKDGGGQIWTDLSAADAESVEQLLTELEKLVKNGQLRGAEASRH